MSLSACSVSMAFVALFAGAGTVAARPAPALKISAADSLAIGKRVWQNECGGTVEGLTSWNQGEGFASLGIGHFIWYPRGQGGPFKESFPGLVRYLDARGVAVPDFAHGPCPWDSRADFEKSRSGERMTALRRMLQSSVALQAEFLVLRLEEALPGMLASLRKSDRDAVRARFEALAASRNGCYALVDYVNFKGEGTAASERYDGQGWGLLQVLEGMDGTPSGRAAVSAFAQSAGEVLTRRVRNAPSARNEGRWLKGWLSRVQAYPAGP